MKRTILMGIFLGLLTFSIAQTRPEKKTQKDRIHKGFYLSMSIGPSFIAVTDVAAGDFDYKYKGTGALFDFKIGGSRKENILLHATLVSSSLVGPKLYAEGTSLKLPDEISIGEGMFGVGFTYYVMPQNILLSASAGIGYFTLSDTKNNVNISTDKGFSFQLKAGKEWWVSRRWGLGIGVTYNRTSLTNRPGDGITELLGSNNISLLFNATFN